MIAYKYKLYQTKRTKHLDAMLREASFVWNHALALQKRYYSLFGKYISKNAMQKHYAKRIKRTLLHSQTTQEIIKYDYIFIEDLSLHGMTRMWGLKMSDLAHAEFVGKLECVARKYSVTVHKIDRFYPSSKTCECGYVNRELKLSDREWVCPECGKVNDRDLNAAENILRRGISELWSGSKSKTVSDTASRACTQESHAL